MSNLDLFADPHPLVHHVIIIFSPSDSSYRLVERHLERIPQVELRWHSDTIEALADLFMSHPGIVVVFGDSNAQGYDFIRLIRNNPHFRDQPIFAVLPEPENFKDKLNKRMSIERFSTPIDGSAMYKKAMEVLKLKPANPA